MDAETLAIALKLAPKKTLPAVSSGDAGEMLVVDNNGEWTKGQAVTSTVSVSGTTLMITE